MSKMSELSQVLQEIKTCGESLVAISEELTEIFSASEEKAEPKKKKTAAKKKEPEAETPAAEPVKEYTFTEVRTILADKSRAGHTADVKKILTAHGAAKLSDLDPKEYGAVVAEAEVLE